MSTPIKKTPPKFNNAHYTGEIEMPSAIARQEEIPVEISETVFIPDWGNKPQEVPPIVTLGGTSILTHKNTSMIIALPGVGKSSICESVCASFLNPEADCLGFSVDPHCQGVIFIDNERTDPDVWNSFYRMAKRAGVQQNTPVKNVTIAGLRSMPRLDDRLRTIEYLLKNNPCNLLMIDGLGDLVSDVNDVMEAKECRYWLRETTSNFSVSILTTIHPNPNSNKPRGHVGSEGLRESECVLLAKSAGQDMRILTSDFEFGKNRNNAPITTAFRWSHELKMFTSADPDSVDFSSRPKGKTLSKLQAIVDQILTPPKALTRTELEKGIVQMEGCSDSTANRRVDSLLEKELIKKYEDGFYRALV